MSECPHCRALDGAPHRHDCSVARKTNQPRAAAPVPALYLGATVIYRQGDAERAAIVVSLKPPLLRVIDPDGKDRNVEKVEYGDGPGKWRWAR